MKIEKVVIGSDHGGFALKERLKAYLYSKGYDVVDFGCYSTDPVDYPDIAFLVADAVSKNKGYYGIMIDGAGVASCIVCNKVPGIRASLCWDDFTATIAREHDNANILCLGGQVLGPALAREVVDTWLRTDFGGGRHERRVNKIMDIETKYTGGGK